MDYRVKQILNKSLSQENINSDSFLNIKLENSHKLMYDDNILRVLNSGNVFENERQNSNFYRVFGVINSTVSNPLFNLYDSTNNDLFTYKGFNYKDINGEYRFFEPFFTDNLKKFLKEKDGWFGYTDADITKASLCNFYDMEPKRERLSFIPDKKPYNSINNSLPIKNWDLTITYPYDSDTTHYMVNGGLIILDKTTAIVADKQMTAFASPCFHNLNIGDVVKITGTTGYDGEHVVVRTGLDNGDLKEYYFVVDVSPINGSLGQNSRFKRIFAGVESKYYFRKFKKVKTRQSEIIENDDYEIFNAAFSENAFNDIVFQFVFNEDVDLTGIKDNLNRPVSEIYLTILKTDSNNLFGIVKSGIEAPEIPYFNTSSTNQYLLNIPVINKIHNGVNQPWLSHIPLETNVTINNDEFYGDLVEYNEYELIETVLADVAHRFNTVNRESNENLPNNFLTYAISPNNTRTIKLGPRQEGYYFKPHHLIKIKEFSSYIEQGTTGDTVGIPDYAVDLGDGRFVWRDLLDVGFKEIDNNGLDYPFLNGSHYLFNNICFKLKRQDPFDNWDLYYSKFPADPVGDAMTNKYDIKTSEDVC